MLLGHIQVTPRHLPRGVPVPPCHAVPSPGSAGQGHLTGASHYTAAFRAPAYTQQHSSPAPQRRREGRGGSSSHDSGTSGAPPSGVWTSAAAALAPTAEQHGPVDTELIRYRCHSKDGAVVDAVVDSRSERTITVRITASYHNVPSRTPERLQLHWGMYRASGSKWHHPREAVPPDSTPEPGGGGAMRTVMSWDAGAGCWAVRFEVPAQLAPLHLAFALHQPGREKYDTPLRAAHFTVPLGMGAGSPEPLGASVVATSRPASGSADPRDVSAAVNFAVFSRHASSLQLCLVRVRAEGADPAAPLVAQNVLEIVLDPLTNRTGDVWHICVHGLKDLGSLCWAWRADGEILWQNGNRFHPGFMLMDPHASRPLPVLLPPSAHKAAPRMAPQLRPDEPVWLGSLAAFVELPFDWQGYHQAATGGRSRIRALEEGVVVEVDVAAFTSGPDAGAQVPPEHRGKYLGLLDRVDTLKAIGATAVMLTPVALSADRSGGAPPSPLSLLAPDPSFAVGGPLAAAEELKTAIRGLHRAGLEVILQVEFCLTSEGGDASAGRLQGLRGLDHAVYYRDGLEAPVLNCGHPVVRQLVVSALRHWAAEYRVDGFCFLNAENLTQDKFGSVLDNPPLAEEIAADPVLRSLRLIAAVSNPALLPRSGERGFPHWGVWSQINDRFRSDLTAYLAGGQRGLLSAVATRLTGSSDLFAPRWDAGLPGGLAAGRRGAFGLNAAGPLGDRPLPAALAAGAAGGDAVRAEAAARSLLLAQFVSGGQPLIAAATLGRPGVAQLVAALAAVRRGYRALLSPGVAAAAEAAASHGASTAADRELAWHSPYGAGEPDWAGSNPDPTANVMVLTVGGGVARPGHMLAVALNPNGEPRSVALPRPPTGACWRLLVDTARPVPTAQAGGSATLGVVLPPAEQGSYTMGPCSAVLLDAVPLAAAQQPQAAAAQQRAPPPPQATGRAPAPPPPQPGTPPPPPSAARKAPPPGYGLSPAAAAAAAAEAAKKKPPTVPYKTTGGTPGTWPGDSAGGPPHSG